MSHSSVKQTLLETNKSDEFPEALHPPMIDDRSYSHSLAVLEKPMDHNTSQTADHPNLQLNQQRISRLNLETPIPSDFEDNLSFNFVNITPQIYVNSNHPSNFDQFLTNNGYASYITEFHQTGSILFI